MNDVAGGSRATSVTVFARWFAPIAAGVAVALLILGQWAGAVGLALASIPVLWFCIRIGNKFQGLRTRKPGSSGALVLAGTNAATGVVILFVGALIGGDFILIVCTLFGTWMIASAAILVVASRSG